MSPCRRLITLLNDLEGLVEGDPQAKADLVSHAKALILEMAQHDDAALGAMLDEVATVLKMTRFFGSGQTSSG